MINKFKNLFNNLKVVEDLRIYFYTAFLILCLHFALQGWHPLEKGYSIFYLDEEYTVATMFTSALAIFAGFEFWKYSFKKDITTWKAFLINISVALGFLFFSLDEYFSIHEYISSFIKKNVSTDNLLNDLVQFSWIFPLLIFILIGVAIFIALIVIENNSFSRNSFILGLLCFITVIVFEPVGGSLYGHFIYPVFVGIEETLEMLGILFFLNGVRIKSKS